MPPAFVLSQDQTLRLTSGPNPQGKPLRANPKDPKPKIGIPSLKNALRLHASHQAADPRSLQGQEPGNQRKSQNTTKRQVQLDMTSQPRQDRRPRIPSQSQQCQTASAFRLKTTNDQGPSPGLGEPPREQSKERCRACTGRPPAETSASRPRQLFRLSNCHCPVQKRQKSPNSCGLAAVVRRTTNYKRPRARSSAANFSGSSSPPSPLARSGGASSSSR